MKSTEYCIIQKEYDPECESFYESLFTLSNGIIGLRPTLDFNCAGSRPGMYVSGIYDFALSVRDQIVNVPNPTDMRFEVDDELINLSFHEILSYDRSLDLHQSVLRTNYSIKLKSTVILSIQKEEFLDDKNNYCCSLCLCATHPVDCRITIGINHSVGNDYHGGYINQFIKSFHTKLNSFSFGETFFHADFYTIKSKHWLFYDCRLEGGMIKAKPHLEQGKIGLSFTVPLRSNRKTSFRFIARMNTKQKCPLDTRCYDDILAKHLSIWEKKWKTFPEINFVDDKLSRNMRYAVYQMLSAYSHNLPIGTNIPARGLSSGYHHGHFFFNTELYMVPWYTWFAPEQAKSLLFYRIYSLGNAIETANEMGHPGAFWAEESGVDGKPAGPEAVIDFASGEKFEEWTGRKVQHIGADILYACQYYCNVTNDIDFEKNYVIHLAKEITDYYLSILAYHDEDRCFEIKDVIGPDEYHIGVDNNFYTNFMVGFAFRYFLYLIDKYNVNLAPDYINKVLFASANIRSHSQKGGVIEQFTGYFKLEDFVVTQRRMNGLPLITDNIKKEIFQFGNISSNIVKQCDVVMLLSLFPKSFPLSLQKETFLYYENRTIHESSLSATHAGLTAATIGDYETAAHYMKISSGFNLDFEPRTNYNNGIHYAAHAGAWLILITGFLGMKIDKGMLCINVSSEWMLAIMNDIHFLFWFFGRSYSMCLTKQGLTIRSQDKQPFAAVINGNKSVSHEHVFQYQGE